jgi:2-hydroxy-3-oxopropionate reductase
LASPAPQSTLCTPQSGRGTRSSIELHQKDLNLALQGARTLGLALPNTASTLQLFNVAAANGGKDWDHSGLVRALELMAGGHEVGERARKAEMLD